MVLAVLRKKANLINMDQEELIKFVEWTKLKIKIHISKKEVYFREGEIWWSCLGVNIGHEQEGKNKNFERPILILKKFNQHTLWAVPLTTKMKENNPYYHQYELNGEEYAAILPQLRLLSSKRLLRRIGIFPLADFEMIREKIKKMI